MIAKDDMMPLLVEACPSFAPTWQAFLDDWQDEPDLPHYVVLGDLARHLIGLVERGELGELPAVFRVVERWHTEGDDYVREAATVGLLEDLQNLNLHEHGTDPSQFRAMLGPVSLRHWNEATASWRELHARKAAGLLPPGPAPTIMWTRSKILRYGGSSSTSTGRSSGGLSI